VEIYSTLQHPTAPHSTLQLETIWLLFYGGMLRPLVRYRGTEGTGTGGPKAGSGRYCRGTRRYLVSWDLGAKGD
jgi:hypothetical protein